MCKANQDRLDPANGIRQGSGSASATWNGTIDPILCILRKHYHAPTINHPALNEIKAWLQISMHTDDSTFSVNWRKSKSNHFETRLVEHMESLPNLMQSLLKAYSGCLWTTGGRLCIERCKWYQMAWRKTTKGKYVMKKNDG